MLYKIRRVTLFLFCTVLTISLLGVVWLIANFTPPFKHVRLEIQGSHIALGNAQTVIRRHVQGGFFSFNAPRLRGALQNLDWVGQVDFRKEWPDKLTVRLVEQKVLARWNDRQLINWQGELFKGGTSVKEAHVPQFLGSPTEVPKMVACYSELKKMFLPVGLRIKVLQLDKHHLWTVQLMPKESATGFTMRLGSDPLGASVSRFVLFYPHWFAARVNELEYVDLRYTNGIAVKWKKIGMSKDKKHEV